MPAVILNPNRSAMGATRFVALIAVAGACLFAAASPASAAGKKQPSSASDQMQRFDPSCGKDSACEVWKGFRVNHPFPTQVFAGQRVADRLVLIFSEPALPKSRLEPLIKVAFGADLLDMQTRRWMIGEDGWLEDVVVTVRWQSDKGPPATDLLANQLLRDRLSLLAEQVWGTAFGLQLEAANAPYAARARGQAPNLDPRPGEINDWLSDATLRWRTNASLPDSMGRPFQELVKGRDVGAYASTDNELTLLLLNPADIEQAMKSPANFERDWRAAFRWFAVASDVVLGATWTDKGSMAIVGRMRRVPVDVIAPLRFETFALLASAGTRELAQSYERTTPLAGKMLGGRHSGSDWAPIYLSKQLIDTEFGALLNITDQMLKSWSMAGQIDYLYFDYPLRPAGTRFAFGAQPLSEIVLRETGAGQVLFNWNTTGSAAVVAQGGSSVLTPTLTGALPITYGAETRPGSGMQFGAQVAPLLRREREAYEYFSQLRDPNLARVVSYTVIYQAFQAHLQRDGQGPIESEHRIVEREDAMQSLVKELERVLAGLADPGAVAKLVETRREFAEVVMRRKVSLSAAQRQAMEGSAQRDLNEIKGLIEKLQQADPRLRDRRKLASLLIDLRTETQAAESAFQVKAKAFDEKVKAYNAGGRLARLTLPSRADLEAADAELVKERERIKTVFGGASRLRGLLRHVPEAFTDLDVVRTRYVAANSAPPAAWIKTPSVVISRGTGRVSGATGGHNLDSHALRIQVDPTATEAKLVEGLDGQTLRVPPSQAKVAGERANELARLVEHGKADDAKVRSLLSQPLNPAMLRSRAAALGAERPSDLRSVAGRAGTEALGDGVLRQQMLNLYDSFGAPFAGMARREANGDFLVVSRVNGKPDCCLRVRDLASFRQQLMTWKGKGEVALVDFNPAQAEALARNLKGPNDAALLEAVGGGGRGGEPPNGTVHFIAGNEGEVPKPPGKGGGAEPPAPGGGDHGGRPSSRDPTALAMTLEHGSAKDARIAMHTPRQFRAAAQELHGAAAEQDLQGLRRAARSPEAQQALDWVPVRDGTPAVFKLSFIDVDPAIPSFEVRLIAGFDPAQSAKGAQLVRQAISSASTERPRQSVFDLQARVKEIVKRDPSGSAVKRLFTYFSEIRQGFLMTRAVRSEDDSPAS